MKFDVLGFLLSVTFQIHAADPFLPEVPLKKIPCEKNLVEALKIEFSERVPRWSREIDANSMTQTFRASKAIGQWYELQLSEKEGPKLFYISSGKSKDFVWNVKTCQPEIREGGGLVLFHQEKNYKVETFTDIDLEKLLAGKSRGIIYLWSPHMVYSVTEFRTFRDVAKKKNLEFIPVLDPSVNIQEAEAAARKVHADFKGRKLASVDLYMRNATLHFPTVFVYANGKMNSRRLVGVLTREGLSQSIDVWMGELKK